MTFAANKTELRKFGLVTGAMFAAIFGLALPWLWGRAVPAWPWILCGVLWAWALAAPLSLGPVFRVWMKAAEGLGWVNNRIILGLVFFLILFPVGAARRLFGRDPLARRYDKTAASYRINRTAVSRDSMEHPY